MNFPDPNTSPRMASPPPPPPVIMPVRSVAAPDESLKMLVPLGVDPVALIAGYLGLFCLIIVPSPLALGFGIWALVRLRRNPAARGRVRAWFAIGAGSVGTLLVLVTVYNLLTYKG